jgi:hypothetical protein
MSGRAILQALCVGERDPERLALLVHKSVAHKQVHLVEALTGDLRSHHLFLLRELREDAGGSGAIHQTRRDRD